ncbi:MAG: hypothetical protein AAF492_18570 [Verrucomicrobiota bacterium]
MGRLLVPILIDGMMTIPLKFPLNRRVSAGIPCRFTLKEVRVIGFYTHSAGAPVFRLRSVGTREGGKKATVAGIAVLPAFLLICYIRLMVYFKSKGGDEPEEPAVAESGV